MNWHATLSSGISGEKVEIDPVTNQKASTKFWIRQKPISIDSDHLCACDLVEERSPSEWTMEIVAYFSSSLFFPPYIAYIQIKRCQDLKVADFMPLFF